MRLLLPLILLLAGCSPAALLNATVPAQGVSVTHDIAYGPRAGDRLDLYRPPGAAGALPVVVFLHGGNWRTGTKADYPFLGLPLAACGMLVAVPDTRLYPEARIAGILDDSARATAFVVAHAAEWGGDPTRVVVMGHSSGAYDAAMVALDPRYGLRGRLAGFVGLAGPYDFLPLDGADTRAVLGDDAGPESQPVTYAGPGAPPMLLLAGAEDDTVRPGNTTSLASHAQAAGNTVEARILPGIGHVGLVSAFAPLFQRRAPVLDLVSAFVLRAIPRPAMPAG